MNLDDYRGKHIHFIGIGGISMHGLALILRSKGYKVSGSDMSYSSCFEKLEKEGITCYETHKKGQEKNADVIVKNSAIAADNVELVEAKKANIPIMERSQVLGYLLLNSRIAFGISGMHGKTTCSSMVATILELCGLDPTVNIGGELDLLNGATKIGGDIFIVEACEYKDNYLRLPLDGAAILNIEEDHLDYFKDLDDIIKSFSKYVSQLSDDGVVVANIDDDNVLEVIKAAKCKIYSFGTDSDAMFRAINIIHDDLGFYSYDLVFNDKLYFVKLGVIGHHNVYNSLAAIAGSYFCGADIGEACKKVGDYKGTKRRFEFSGKLDCDCEVYHDYAHHPTEVKAILKSVKIRCKGKLICVFQPHTYSRTMKLLDEFSDAFADADYVIVTDIYAAREVDKGEIHSLDLVKKINIKHPNKKCIYAKTFDEAADACLELADSNDIILTLGAGTIVNINKDIVHRGKL